MVASEIWQHTLNTLFGVPLPKGFPSYNPSTLISLRPGTSGNKGICSAAGRLLSSDTKDAEVERITEAADGYLKKFSFMNREPLSRNLYGDMIVGSYAIFANFLPDERLRREFYERIQIAYYLLAEFSVDTFPTWTGARSGIFSDGKLPVGWDHRWVDVLKWNGKKTSIFGTMLYRMDFEPVSEGEVLDYMRKHGVSGSFEFLQWEEEERLSAATVNALPVNWGSTAPMEVVFADSNGERYWLIANDPLARGTAQNSMAIVDTAKAGIDVYLPNYPHKHSWRGGIRTPKGEYIVKHLVWSGRDVDMVVGEHDETSSGNYGDELVMEDDAPPAVAVDTTTPSEPVPPSSGESGSALEVLDELEEKLTGLLNALNIILDKYAPPKDGED